MKIAAIVVASLLLAGCAQTEEEKAVVRTKLPAGCQLMELGEYGSIRNLIIVTCRNRDTTTINSREQHGKAHQYFATAVIE